MVICGPRPFLNEPIIANQRTKFNIFSMIIDLESPENITAVVWSRLSKKPEIVRKSRFFNILRIFNEWFNWTALIPEAKLFRMRRSIIWYEDLVYGEYMNIIYKFRSFIHKYCVFDVFLPVIAPPIIRSAWNFVCLLRVVWHMFSPCFVTFWVFV